MLRRWRNRKGRALVCSSGGVRNCGDDAILLRTLERLGARGYAAVDVLTDEDRALAGLGTAQRIGTTSTPPHDLRRYDLVVMAGGGFSCDWFGAHLAPRRALAEQSRAAGVPMLVTGQGIGPMTNPKYIDDLCSIARNAVAFSTRDAPSCEWLREHHITATVTGDDSLGLIPREPVTRGNYVALHLREASYHVDNLDALAAWTHATSAYARSLQCDVVGVAVNDRPEAPEAATLRALGVETIIDVTSDPRRMVAVVQGADAVVAHSYHVALFALAAGRPALLAAAGPYYEGKAEGLRRLVSASAALAATQPPALSELRDRLDATRADLQGNDALARAAANVDSFFTRHGARPAR